ncbi:MAG TPA: FKBP-type peptidyl-prolyl cis-trans isomerase [Saprospiraceae bacterium]|nr:FKBP-type peptidyl-prolyl cis-trans isomerase [Saprospiraceae bacterium]
MKSIAKMINNLTFWSLLLLLLLLGCRQSTPASSGESFLPPPPADEEGLLLRLSAALIADPQQQSEKDHNAIIHYALDHLLEVQSTPSGLFYQILKPGTGAPLSWGERVSVHYRGYFTNGQVFDASRQRGKPLEFYIGNMIDGWNEGLQLLRPGAQALLLIPSQLAYGESGLRDARGQVLVPPNSVLIFEIEVLRRL